MTHPPRPGSRRRHLTPPPDWSDRSTEERLLELWMRWSTQQQEVDQLKGYAKSLEGSLGLFQGAVKERIAEFAAKIEAMERHVAQMPEDLGRLLGELAARAKAEKEHGTKIAEHDVEIKKHGKLLALRRLTLIVCMIMAPSLKDIVKLALRKLGVPLE